ncbi:hypothetical protein NDU88_001850 [Pleurodeles waltl]|uniref:Retrotransposon gag domain-containing protein n=1 Tax=Pleurodeles waltl TaxID=8319 RepID=A0AAV7U994_PLEWA|nr:hypothetical protein NDU88_001850 [Pleurodeles waltl]
MEDSSTAAAEFNQSLLLTIQQQAQELQKFAQDKTKVGYLISALSGPALAWATPLVAANYPMSSDYSAFLTAFKQMFVRPGLKASAEEALCDVQQGNQDVLQYITRFRQPAAETPWLKRTLVTLFRRGLRDEIKDELVHSTRVEDLRGLMDQALSLECRLKEHRLERRKTCGSSYAGNPCTIVHHCEET